MYFLLGTSLIFALLLVLNVAASALASGAWRIIEPRARRKSAEQRAQIIFALRVLPTVAAILAVAAFLLPAYVLFEPHASDETVTFKLGALALVSLIGIGAAFYRVFGSWQSTRRLLNDWLSNSEQIALGDVSIPVYAIEHPFPVIAVVGTIRPRLFIARQIFSTLSEEEISATLRHEYGHLAARDNLKRTVLRVCRDLLVFAPFARRLDRIWAENAESAADEYAARAGGNLTAINLAAALVKIARIVPTGARPAMPSGAFLLGEQAADVTGRVRRLLRLAEGKLLPARHLWLGLGRSFWFPLLVVFAVVSALATNQIFLQKVHTALESVVLVLQ